MSNNSLIVAVMIVALLAVIYWRKTKISAKEDKLDKEIEAKFSELPETKLSDWKLGSICPQCGYLEYNEGKCLVLITLCPYCGYFGEYILVKYQRKLMKCWEPYRHYEEVDRVNITPVNPGETAVYSVCSYCTQPIDKCGCGANREISKLIEVS